MVLTFVDYSVSGTGVLLKKGNPDGSSHRGLLRQGRGHRVGHHPGQLHQEPPAPVPAGRQSPLEVQTYPKYSHAQLAVKAGKAEAVVADKPVSTFEAKTIGGGNVFEVVDDPEALGGYEASPKGSGMARSNAELAKAIRRRSNR